MPNKQQAPLRRALHEEQLRYAAQAYPGDLAAETLAQVPRPGLFQMLRYPMLACAAVGLGLAIAISLLPNSDPLTSDSQMLATQPTPGPIPAQHDEVPAPLPTLPTPPAAEQAQPKTQAFAQPLPEIDRNLLPLKRVGQSTWLTSAAIPQQQLEKQARLAQNPNIKQRIRLTLSAPNRSTIGRATARQLSLQPTPKPERTS